MYVIITAFTVWFVMHQRAQQIQHSLDEQQTKYVKLQIENKMLQDSLEILRPYHKARVDLTTLAALTETKNRSEIEYVSTVIRNRVKMCFGGNCTFFSVIAQPHQFSGIWKDARHLVEEVILAEQDVLPLPKQVTHFYSPRSIRQKPMWSKVRTEHQAKPISSNRFRFYESK